MSGRFELTDAEYAVIEPLLPDRTPQRGGRWRDHRQVINGILFRVRTGVPWRDVPDRYGPWETLYKRFARWEEDGTWARVEAHLQTRADAAGELDWHGHADSSVVRAHQHAAGAQKEGSTLRIRRAGRVLAGRGAGSPRRSTRSVRGGAAT
jgi:transposase